MYRKGRIWTLLVILVSFWSCQELPPTAPDSFVFPTELQLPPDSTAVDTSFYPPLKLPFQWLDQWQKDSLLRWTENYFTYTKKHLQTDQTFKSRLADQQIIGFPKKINQEYFALADFAGKRGIYRGSDLSTLSTYQAYLLDSGLRLPNYQIHDFAFLEKNPKKLALLLYQTKEAQYRAAYYNVQDDSLTIWTNLAVTPNWQVKNQQIWVHSPEEEQIFQIDPSRAELRAFNLSPFKESKPQFLAVLNSNQALISVKEDLSSTSYYQLSEESPPEKIFTFHQGRNQWLAYQRGLHYFMADFKNGQFQIFSFRSTPSQDSLQTVTLPDNTQLLKAQLNDSLIIGLYGGPEHTELRKYSLEGDLISRVQLSEALSSLDFWHYTDGDHSLVRQLSPEDGLRWLNVDTKLPTVVEPVYRSLVPLAQFNIQKTTKWIPSYDGYRLALNIYYQPSPLPLKDRPSLIIPVSSKLDFFRKQLVDLAVVNRSLQAHYIVVFVFPRGNERLKSTDYLQGRGAYLQLAYDDLQAGLSYLNEQQLGDLDHRTVWGIEEGALSAAALYMQRPSLAQKVILQEGVFDLRSSQVGAQLGALGWIHPVDSLSDRLSVKYSPQFYPIRSALYPNCLVQISNQSIFADHLQTYKWLGKLQNLPGVPPIWLVPRTVSPAGQASGKQEWEQMVWNYIQKEYVSR